ncbi:MAG: DUF4129 domain-containing protein, partial [Pseudomonadota bacterium]
KTLLLKDFIPWLLWRRLSVQRAFDAPVTLLEGLKGAARSNRLRVLHGKFSDVALSNQFVCFCFELLLWLGIAILIEFFVPEDVGLSLLGDSDEMAISDKWILAVSGYFAMILILPFHCMAGFSLYLNRRIELEAWDIEISFRNLAERKLNALQRVMSFASVFVLAAMLNFGLPQASQAATDHTRESASELIESVLQGKDYGEEKTVSKWRFKDWIPEEEDEETIFPEWLIDLLVWLEKNLDWDDELSSAALWMKILLIVAFVGLLIYLFHRFRGPLSGFIGSHKTPDEPPKVLFGLDVRPESLPQDVPAQVLALWHAEQFREALGLLYRASLSRLIDKYKLGFRDSHTEAECAQLVTDHGVSSLSEYFSGLTRVWRRQAYGHIPPSQETVESLCRGWQKELSDEPG